MLKPGTTDYKRERNAALYDRLNIVIPKGRKQAVEAYAQENDLSVNGLVNALLRDALGMTDGQWRAADQAED